MKKQTVEQRREIADNPSTPVDVLVQLVADNNEGVRLYVARNSEILTKEQKESARSCVQKCTDAIQMLKAL